MSPVLRWTRGLLLAGVALSTGTLAHVSAGGLLPGLPVMAALLALGSCVCASLLGRPASRTRVVLLVVVGQSAVHLVLTGLSGHAGVPAATSRAVPLAAGPRTGTFFDQTMPVVPSPDLSMPVWVHHLVADVSGPNALMALAHLAAAALVGLWLASGEQAFAGLLQLALRREVPTLSLPGPLPRASSFLRAFVPALLLWRGLVARRGPPYSPA